MRTVKSLLLGSAAGLVAAAGAQAADLPVKAKPVEYVRVCSLYGAGFWYVPGTDTCLKIGSYIRVQTSWDAEGGGIPIGFGNTDSATAGRFTRTDTSELAFRTRSAISVDLRTQTEYGTLRSYLEVDAQLSTGTGTAAQADTIFFDRGFIQFAGFTAGRIRSYFDINSFAPYSYSNNRVSGDTGAAGIYGIAYTAQFGNGVTGTLSFEDGGAQSNGNLTGPAEARGHMVTNLSMVNQFGLGTTSYDNAGWRFPDVVGALRIDQAWGYAQVAAALHDASGGYYQTGGTALAAGIEANGHPGDVNLGWAATAGFTLNDVLGLKGDQFGMQAAYSQGAAGYVTRATGPFQIYGSGHSAGFGWVTDGVFTTGSNIELTTVWGINGFYQHFWNPKWRTSLYGGFVEVDYDSTARTDFCTAVGVTTPAVAFVPGAGTNCTPNFSWWQVGTRTQWNPHPDLDIGVDVLYNHLNTAFPGTATLAANGARTGGIYTIEDQNVLSVFFRIQRNFLP
jgi:Porin subfamily